MIVPQAKTYALLLSRLRNPKACPILAVGNVGNPGLPLPGRPLTSGLCCRAIGQPPSHDLPALYFYRARGAGGRWGEVGQRGCRRAVEVRGMSRGGIIKALTHPHCEIIAAHLKMG